MLGLLVITLIGMAVPVFARTPIIPDPCRLGHEGCNLCYMAVGVNNLTDFLMKDIALPAAVLLIAIGGIVLLTSGSSETRVTLGKTILTSALIGIVIVFLAWIMVDTIVKVLTGKNELVSRFGPWNTIPQEDLAKCPI